MTYIMEEHTICLQCGDRGFTNAFVYCVRCLNFAVHRYCLPVIPETLDEFVRWFCDDCEAKGLSQVPVYRHHVSSSPTRGRKASKKFEVLSQNRMEINDLAVARTQTDEHVHDIGHERSSDSCKKLDLVECGDQLANQMQLEGKSDDHVADEREIRSQQSPSFEGIVEERVEEDLTKKRKRMYQTTKNKRRWTHVKRKSESNVIQVATKKDQLKLDKTERKDPTPKKKTKTKWTHKKRQRTSSLIESATKANQTSSKKSCEECITADINGCQSLVSDFKLPSEVRKHNGSEERKKTCISNKLSESDADLGSVEHPDISCNVPLRKKQKTIDLSNLASSNRCIDNVEPEVKEEKASETLHTSYICRDYLKELVVVAAEPVVTPIWRGSVSILNEKCDKLDELMAHISCKACPQVYETASQFKPMLQLEMLPKSEIWPKSFEKSEPTGDNIALYFFPSKISEQKFDLLVDQMMSNELGLKAIVQNAELLIFTSTELPLLYWRFYGKHYLWGVFRGKQNPPSHCHSSK